MPTIVDLLNIMARLRDPGKGCPWDVKQTFATIAPHTLEEAYEVIDAIDRQDYDALSDELGDLLLQVVYHSQMAAESDLFDFDDVVGKICDKLVRRHPHVFGDAVDSSRQTLARRWEQDKARQRQDKGHASVMDDITKNLPQLKLADKIQRRAAHFGFDWPRAEGVFDKLNEEIKELRAAIAADADVTEEVGDLLFTVANLARHLEVDPEFALRAGNAKFERRFRQLEAKLGARELSLEKASPEEMEEAWAQVKEEERS